MVFSSAVFLYWFLPAFLVLYAVTPRKLRPLLICISSLVFYGWWRPDFAGLMVFSAVLDFTCGGRIAAAQSRGRNGTPWLVGAVTINLGLLAYFKYANFGVSTLNAVLARFGAQPVAWTEVLLPIGISFYTFQTLSYTIDVYRKAIPATSDFITFASYVTMFPQLVAGPIVRYRSVAEQLVHRDHTLEKFFQGVLALQCGLAKKILLADPLGGLADAAFSAPSLSPLDAWTGVLAYAFQLYFDFSGYSDMAMGLGLMMGFRLPVNFDSPYRATSITDFWRRWHISLSTWLRDYLYIPLGGNRKGPLRTYVNLALVMLLGGLWHGANWTFIAWGAWQGLWLIVERAAGKHGLPVRAPVPVKAAITFGLVLVGWVFFRAPDLGAASHYLTCMAGAGGGAPAAPLQVRPVHLLALGAAALVTWGMPPSRRLLETFRPWWTLALQPLCLVAMLHLDFQDHVPFLYYQF